MAEGQSPTTGNIFTALHSVYQQVGYVQKKGKNTAQNYRYAGEKDLIEALRPAMVEAGIVFFCSGISDQETREVRKSTPRGESVTINFAATFHFTFAHAVSGTSIQVAARGEGADSLDKASAKAMTGALKYALRQTFVIETGDDPDDHRNYRRDDAEEPANDPPPPRQQRQPHEQLLAEAQSRIRAVPGMDGATLRQARDWLREAPDGKGPNRWALLGKIDRDVRDELAGALNRRAVELGIDLREDADPQPPKGGNRQPQRPQPRQDAPPQRQSQGGPAPSPHEEVDAALARQDATRQKPSADAKAKGRGIVLYGPQGERLHVCERASDWLAMFRQALLDYPADAPFVAEHNYPTLEALARKYPEQFGEDLQNAAAILPKDAVEKLQAAE